METGYGSRPGYWDSLHTSERHALTHVGARLTFSGGDLLIRPDDATRDVVFVWSGFTKVVTRAGDKRHVVLALRGPGEILGEMAHVGGGPRSAAVAAINEVEALRVPRAEFSRFLGRSARASHLLQRTLVERLRDADRDRVAAASLSVGQRLARLLLKLVWQYGVPDDDGGRTVAMLSQDDLAACVGGARRTVAREIAQWRERGAVSTIRLSVTVHDPEYLARKVGSDAPPI